MRILGYYRELWPASAGTSGGSISDFVQKFPPQFAEEMARYLISGYCIFSVMGSSKDVLESGENIADGNSIYTDGQWVWRGDLWFYLYRYNVQLAEYFVSDFQNGKRAMPSVSHEARVGITDQVRNALIDTWG